MENHAAATALNYFTYNFIKIHRTLRTSQAMAAGVTDRLWSVEDRSIVTTAAHAMDFGNALERFCEQSPIQPLPPLGNRSPRRSRSAHKVDPVLAYENGRSAEALSFCTGVAKASLDPFDDQTALQLRHCAKYREYHPACWCAGINIFRKRNEVDSDCLKLLERTEKVRYRAGEAIKTPDYNCAKPFSSRVSHQLIQAWAGILRTAQF
jgi:hypothetical protein